MDSGISLEMSKNNRSLGLGEICDLCSKSQRSIYRNTPASIWALAMGADALLPA